jgi:hypothetical protein
VPILLTALLLGFIVGGPKPHPAPVSPKVSAIHVGKPGISVPSPSLNAPHLSPPSVSVPSPSLPNIDSGGDDSKPQPSAPPGPARRTEFVHVHHRHWIWDFDLPLLLLALAALAVARPLSRLPRPDQRVFNAAMATGLVALGTLAFVVGISQEQGSGTDHREPPDIERSPEAIVTRIVVDHFHAPVHLSVPWIIVGLGLAVLAIPTARVAVAARKQEELSQDERGAT